MAAQERWQQLETELEKLSSWWPLNSGKIYIFFLQLFQDFVKVNFFFEADMVTYTNWFVAGVIRRPNSYTVAY